MQQMMGGQLPPGMENDPMFKLLASMGGAGGMGGGFPGGPVGGEMGGMGGMPELGGMPPGLAAMAGMAGMQGGPMQQASGPTTQDWLWRILHGFAAMMLAIWVLTTSMSGFDGRELSREKTAIPGEGRRPVIILSLRGTKWKWLTFYDRSCSGTLLRWSLFCSLQDSCWKKEDRRRTLG